MGKGNGQGQMISHEESLRLGLWAANIGACVPRPFVNSRMGKHAMGMEWAIASVAIPVIAEHCRSPQMMTLWYAWIAMSIFMRVTADRSQRTNYIGHPPLHWLLGHRIGRFAEPFVILGIGYLLAGWSVPVSKLVNFGALCVLVQNEISRLREARIRDAIHDAGFDAPQMAHYR